MQSKRSLSRRHVLRTVVAAGIGANATIVFAACGEAQVVEKIVTVVKEVPVERIVTQIVTEIIEKVVTHEVEVDKIVEKVVTVVAQAPQIETQFVRYATDWNSGARHDTMEAAQEEFGKQHPEIVINMEHASRLNELVALSLAAGTGPDAMLGVGYRFAPLRDVGMFLEITPLLQALEFRLDDYLYSQSNANTIDGLWYGIPFQFAANSYHYSITMFEAGGVAAPPSDHAAGWTHLEIEEAAKRLTNIEAFQYGLTTGHAIDGMYGDIALPWIGTVDWWADPPVFTRSNFEDEGTLAAWEWFVSLAQDSKVVPTGAVIQSLRSSSTTNPFQAGFVAMSRGGVAAGAAERTIRDTFKWGVMGLPRPAHVDLRRAGSNNRPNWVNALVQERGIAEATVKWCIFCAGAFVGERTAQDRGSIPDLRQIAYGDVFMRDPPLNQAANTWVLDNHQSYQQGWVPNWINHYRAWDTALALGWNGEATAEESWTEGRERAALALIEGTPPGLPD